MTTDEYRKRKLELYEEQLKLNKEMLLIAKENLEISKKVLNSKKTVEYVPVYPYQPSTTQPNITYCDNKSR